MRDEELEIVSEYTVQIWVNSALLQVLDGLRLMCVHSKHGLCHLEVTLLASTDSLIEIQPLLKSLDESLLGDRLGLLADEAAAERIVEATAGSE